MKKSIPLIFSDNDANTYLLEVINNLLKENVRLWVENKELKQANLENISVEFKKAL